VTGHELMARLERLAADFPLVYLEDPFDARHTALWRELTGRLSGRVLVAGDDLFATSARRVDPALAGAVVLKPSQAGTVSATVAAARAARAAGMELCVSHRSGETDDPAICDLAVGLGARYLKLGGPRRGDRLAKYNQLLRLAEDPAVAPAARPTSHDLAEAT
jgi:enolase